MVSLTGELTLCNPGHHPGLHQLQQPFEGECRHGAPHAHAQRRTLVAMPVAQSAGAGASARGVASGTTLAPAIRRWAIGHPVRLNRNITPATALSAWPLDAWGARHE